ncbi:MAG TPA: DCC1-like thiol-disulfide oxidoreductase family protein [Candidatus Dormibacteraeota bacterium]|jgi:predicted DCC family thiol-disulfide oxidoreductase YuxK|nr:DCC1-like thiol-disulfide oxidoreductase family protein [Candidatus Dormibacteraeota bacterium]
MWLVLYDADCGMCTRFKKTIDLLDWHRNLTFMSIDYAEQIGLLDSLPDSRRHSSFHLVRPDKQLESGEKALPDLIRLLPAGRLVVRMISSIPAGLTMLNLVYSTVSRLHEAGSCKMRGAVNRPPIPAGESLDLEPFWTSQETAMTRLVFSARYALPIRDECAATL